MRKDLSKLATVRTRFRAKVSRFGTKQTLRDTQDTVCLIDVIHIDTGEIITDHLWLNVGRSLWKLSLQIGDVIEFDARVNQYVKGYFGHRNETRQIPTLDYGLQRPTKIVKVST
ncbi:hypothetical protein NDI39_31160 [Microcoleus sp. ZQ-A2]|nr:hypothetical protein [Microcoleus sp. FACHB-1]